MIKKWIVFLFLCSIGFAGFGQDLTKEEKKELLAQIKQLKKDPIQLKYLQESVDVKDVIIGEQTNEIISLKKEAMQARIALKEAQDSIAALEIAQADAQPTEIQMEGFHYRVQIGLYRDFNITQLLDKHKFMVYEQIDGLYRYSIGNFDKLSTAEYFAEEMRKLGIKGAFVSQYYDGERIYEEATETPTLPKKKKKSPFDPYYNSGTK